MGIIFIWLCTLTHLYAHYSHTARGTTATAGVSLTALLTRIEELQSHIEDKQFELERLMQSVSSN